jgi:ElaB/YqjD/DUF883 family membrane-anchored ribosome-binding protein
MDTWFSDRRAMQRSRKRLNNDLKNLMADTEDLLRATASHTGTEVEQGRMRLKRQLEAMREHTDGWRDSAIDTFHEQADRAPVGFSNSYCQRQHDR